MDRMKPTWITINAAWLAGSYPPGKDGKER
jgi:hypothetical protein